jgi:hypothetical protein
MTDGLSPAAAPPSSPARHLLTLIVDALQVPEPAPTAEDEAAYLALVSSRCGLVLTACRRRASFAVAVRRYRFAAAARC